MLRVFAVIAIFSFLFGCSESTPSKAKTEAVMPAADSVYTNGNIHTMDAANPTAQAIAIIGDKIVFVGSSEDAEDYIGKATNVTDLEGKMTLPGFIDAHAHVVAGGLIMVGVDLQADTPEEILQKIQDEVKSNDADQIFGYGIRFNPWTNGFPTAAMLDEIESERPLYFWTISGHGAWVNSKTLELAGITKDTPDTVPGYSYFERDEEGNPTGWIVELPAQIQVLSALVDITPAYLEVGVKEWLSRFSAAGITSAQDLGIQGMTQDEGYSMFTQFANNKELPLRLRGVYYWNDANDDPIAGFEKLAAKYDNPLIKPSKIKINIDGGDDNDNALFVDGYLSDPDLDPAPIIPAKRINEVVLQADAKGIDVVCHCFGDGAVRIMLDAVEGAILANPKRDRRNGIGHGLWIHEDDRPRIPELGMYYESTGAWSSYDPNYQLISDDKLGKERVQQVIPARAVIDAGGTFVLGSDWPVSGYISEYRPLVAIETSITRTLDGRKDTAPLGGKDAGITLDMALKAATIDAAWAIGMETEIGSIAVGKKADLVVLDDDLYQLDANDISEVDVVHTVMGGDVVYSADAPH